MLICDFVPLISLQSHSVYSVYQFIVFISLRLIVIHMGSLLKINKIETTQCRQDQTVIFLNNCRSCVRDLKTLIESRYDCPLILQLPQIFVKTTIITTLRRRILEVKSSKEIRVGHQRDLFILVHKNKNTLEEKVIRNILFLTQCYQLVLRGKILTISKMQSCRLKILTFKGSSTNQSRLKQRTFSNKGAGRGLQPFLLKMTSWIRKNIAIKVD